MRLIDADALRIAIDKLEAESDMPNMWHKGIAFAVNRIVHAPAVDAEPVVRCKDCVYCKRFNDVWYLPKSDELLCTLYVETYHTTENDFCSRGERRKDGKVD